MSVISDNTYLIVNVIIFTVNHRCWCITPVCAMTIGACWHTLQVMLLQEQDIDEHFAVQEHLMTFKTWSGAIFSSICIGVRRLFSNLFDAIKVIFVGRFAVLSTHVMCWRLCASHMLDLPTCRCKMECSHPVTRGRRCQWRGNRGVRGSNDPGNLPGVKHGILTPRFFGKKYFLVHTYTLLLRLQVAYGRILRHFCKLTYVDMNLHHNYIIFWN